MKLLRFLLLPAVILFFVPLHAKTDNGIKQGVSATCSYLPVRYLYFDPNIGYYNTLINGVGLGVDYRLDIPLFNSNFELRAGLGLNYSRTDESDINEYNINGPYGATQPIYVNCRYITQRGYCFAYFPFGLDYRFRLSSNIYVAPFIGLQAKYNISYKEKYCVESVSWIDSYYDLFDYSVIDKKESDPKRMILQAQSGLEIEFKRMFMTMSYSRDSERLFSIAKFKNRNLGIRGPYTFNYWQLGIGFNF